MEEIDYIKSKTGKEPLLRGFEMLAYSPNINDNDASEACLTEVYEGRLLVDHDPDGRDFAQSRVACQPVGMGGGEGAEVGLPRVVGAVAFLFQARRLIL